MGIVGQGAGRSSRIICGQDPIGPDPFLTSWAPQLNLAPDLTFNRQGDANGDGPAAFGFSEGPVQAAPTFTWARKMPAGDHDPVYAQFLGGAWTEPIVIATNPADDLDPAWFQDASGTQHAAWWRAGADNAGGTILYARRAPEQPSFGAEETVSSDGEAAGAPSLVVLPSGEVLIAYEAEAQPGVKRVVVASRAPASGVFLTTVIAETSFMGPLSPEIRARAGRPWVSWVGSSSEFGYSRRTDGAWATPSGTEPYQGVADAPRARIAVRARMIGP